MGLNCAIEKRVQVITPHAEVISHELMRLRSDLLNPKLWNKKVAYFRSQFDPFSRKQGPVFLKQKYLTSFLMRCTENIVAGKNL